MAESSEQRAESRKQKAESKEQRAASRKQELPLPLNHAPFTLGCCALFGYCAGTFPKEHRDRWPEEHRDDAGGYCAGTMCLPPTQGTRHSANSE